MFKSVKLSFILVSALVICGLGSWQLWRWHKTSVDVTHLPPLTEVDPLQKRIAQELTNTPENPMNKIAFEYFKTLINERKDIAQVYFSSRGLFALSDSGFAAARFLAAYPVLGGGPGFSEFGVWNENEMNKNPDEIFRSLKKTDQYFQSTLSHQAVLNLVQKLRLPASMKMDFYANSILKSLKFNQDGDVVAGSESFEMSLMMLKDSEISALSVEPVIKQLVKDHQNFKSKSILKNRVTSLYPDLQYLFL